LGLSNALSGGIVIVVMITMMLSFLLIYESSLSVNDAAIDNFDSQNTIYHTSISLGSLVSTQSIANLTFTLTNNDQEKLWDFDDFDVIIEYVGETGSGTRHIEELSYSDECGTLIFVSDRDNDRIQIFDSSGTYLSQFGSSGTGDGQFDDPMSVEVDSSGDIYVVDNNNSRIQIFDSSGTYLSQFGSSGSGNGQFNEPEDVTVVSYPPVGYWCIGTWNNDQMDPNILNNAESVDILATLSDTMFDTGIIIVTVSTDNGVFATISQLIS